MLNHTSLSSVLKSIHKISSKDGKSLSLLQYATLTPKAVTIPGEGLFEGDKTEERVVISYESLDKFRLEYELPVTEAIPGVLLLPVGEAVKFLDKAKIRAGEQVRITATKTAAAGKEPARYEAVVGYVKDDATRIEARLDSVNPDDMLNVMTDLESDLGDVLTINTAIFTKYLARALTTTSDDIARSNLTWVCTAFKDGLMSFTTTDGHRLYRVAVNGVEGLSTICTDTDHPLFLTQRVASTLLDVLDNSQPFQLTILKGKYGTIEYEIRQGLMRLLVKDGLEGRFPDFTRILPTVDHKTAIFSVPCADLVESCDLATAFANKDGGMFLSFVKNTLTCSNAKFTQDIQTTRSSALHDVKVSVSSRYLKDAIQTLMPDGVKKNRHLTLKVWDTLSPMILQGDSLDAGVAEEYQVVMPMRM